MTAIRFQPLLVQPKLPVFKNAGRLNDPSRDVLEIRFGGEQAKKYVQEFQKKLAGADPAVDFQSAVETTDSCMKKVVTGKFWKIQVPYPSDYKPFLNISSVRAALTKGEAVLISENGAIAIFKIPEFARDFEPAPSLAVLAFLSDHEPFQKPGADGKQVFENLPQARLQALSFISTRVNEPAYGVLAIALAGSPRSTPE